MNDKVLGALRLVVAGTHNPTWTAGSFKGQEILTRIGS